MGGVFRQPENKRNNKGRNLVKANPSFKILQIKCGPGKTANVKKVIAATSPGGTF